MKPPHRTLPAGSLARWSMRRAWAGVVLDSCATLAQTAFASGAGTCSPSRTMTAHATVAAFMMAIVKLQPCGPPRSAVAGSPKARANLKRRV